MVHWPFFKHFILRTFQIIFDGSLTYLYPKMFMHMKKQAFWHAFDNNPRWCKSGNKYLPRILSIRARRRTPGEASQVIAIMQSSDGPGCKDNDEDITKTKTRRSEEEEQEELGEGGDSVNLG